MTDIDLEKLARELELHFVPKKHSLNIARHVAKMVIEARILEVNCWGKYYPLPEVISNYVGILESQLSKLKEEK